MGEVDLSLIEEKCSFALGVSCGGMGLTWAACAAHDADVYLDDLPLMQERVKGLAWGLEDFKGHGCFTVW